MTAVYVAGASAQIERCEAFIAKLKDLDGFRISHDWTKVMRDDARIRSIQHEFLKNCARDDFEGVVSADLLILLVPSPGLSSTGCWGELCIALSHDVPVWVVGDRRACIFAELANKFFVNENEVLAALGMKG